MDIVDQGVVDLSHVRYFVLDEADEMMERGFIFDIKKLLEMCLDDVS